MTTKPKRQLSRKRGKITPTFDELGTVRKKIKAIKKKHEDKRKKKK